MLIRILSLTMFICVTFFVVGCTGDVSTTDDSTKFEVETPKVELGDEELDLNPATDDDVDIDTPLDGDL